MLFSSSAAFFSFPLSLSPLVHESFHLSAYLTSISNHSIEVISDLFIVETRIIHWICFLSVEMDEQLKRLEVLTGRLESVIGHLSSADVNGQSNGNDDLDNSPILRDYHVLLNDSVKPFVVLSQKIGGDLTGMTDHVTRLFDAQQGFLKQAVQSKKPNDQQLMEAIKSQSNEIEAITGIRIHFDDL